MTRGTVRGQCYCGQVRFEADLPSRFVCHCHCHNCRRAHGAGFVTWAGFPKRQFRVLEGAASLSRYHTETQATRSFCGRCGSPLFFESPRWGEEVHVAAAHFLDPLDRLPALHFYADRSPDWCPITDDLPRYGGADGAQRIS